MNRLIICCVVAGLGLAGCRKSGAGGLPPVTEDGKNTFGCKINGEVWVPYFPCGFLSGGNALAYSMMPDSTVAGDPLQFSLDANNHNDGGSGWIMHHFTPLTAHIYGPGNYIDSIFIQFWGPENSIAAGYWHNTLQNPGDTSAHYFLITKLDTVRKIISGVFAFKMYGGTGGGIDSIEVTEGRFDLRLWGGASCN